MCCLFEVRCALSLPGVGRCPLFVVSFLLSIVRCLLSVVCFFLLYVVCCLLCVV